MGTPLKLLSRQDNWLLAQTPDEYIAWISNSELTIMNDSSFAAWRSREKLFFTQLEGHSYADTSEQVPVSDLVLGSIISKATSLTETHQEIHYPDGRKAWIRTTDATPLEALYADSASSYHSARIFYATPQLIGRPYLWGGTSPKGFDCSGLTKFLFFLGGWIIPRDASQQAEEGDTIKVDAHWSNLQAGDLLFFGPKQRPTQRVTHVGLWIGEGYFIHASGRVRINSVHRGDPSYDSSFVHRYLFAKRYTAPSDRIIPITRAGIFLDKGQSARN